jgi:RNA polymerase sigma factor (sigma-70 family)
MDDQIADSVATGVDVELATRFAGGDDAAFTSVYRLYARPIHDYVLGIVRDHALAEDVTQAVFVRAFEQRTTLREPGALRAWLYRIAHNVAVNQVGRTRTTDELDDDVPIATSAPGPEQLVAQDESARLVWDAAASLESRQFAVLDLALRKGLSASEIGEVLGVDTPQASLALHRAREALGNAVRYLAVARRRGRCARLDELIPAGVRALTVEQRATVDRHMRRCSDCQNTASLLTSAAELFAAIPIASLPETLEHWTPHRPSKKPRIGRRFARHVAARPWFSAIMTVAVIAAGTTIVITVNHRRHEPPARSTTGRAATVALTLGHPWGNPSTAQRGYGTIRPALINNGGDPTGIVTNVHWQSWGGTQATGTGTGTYVPDNTPVAAGTQEPVTVVAFDPGLCHGKLMYQAIEWFFPQHAQHFDPHTYINICTGTYVTDNRQNGDTTNP